VVDERNGRQRSQRANNSGKDHQAQVMIVYDAVIDSKHFVHHSNSRLSGTDKNYPTSNSTALTRVLNAVENDPRIVRWLGKCVGAH
jgi:hypothetical protein